MNLLSLFSSRTIKPIWQFSSNQTIWRIMFSRNGWIIGEERDTEKKSVTFFCLEAATGKILWQGKSFNEQWWIGLSGVTDERLFLHGFRKPDMPEHKTIIAVDLQTGNEEWRNVDCAFLGIHPTGIFGYKDLFERRIYYRIDPTSGTILEELPSLPEGIDANTQYENTDFTFPEPLSDSDAITAFGNSGDGSFAGAEQIQTDRYSIVNRYSRRPAADEGLKNSLVIIDRTTKKKVYSDVLNEQTPYPVPDSFFLDGEMLYYIKERKTFVAVRLTSGGN